MGFLLNLKGSEKTKCQLLEITDKTFSKMSDRYIATVSPSQLIINSECLILR